MKREWFRRPTRFQHQFGETEKLNDPLGVRTWELPDFPLPGAERFSQFGDKREIQQYGEHKHREDPSPIQTPSGRMASTDGPAPDLPQIIAMPVSIGTLTRGGGKTKARHLK